MAVNHQGQFAATTISFNLPLGGSLSGVAGRNSFGIAAEFLGRAWKPGFALLADCVLEDRLIPPMRGPEDLDAMRRTQMLINIVFFVNRSMDYNIFHVKVLDQHPGDSQGRLTGFTAGFTPTRSMALRSTPASSRTRL